GLGRPICGPRAGPMPWCCCRRATFGTQQGHGSRRLFATNNVGTRFQRVRGTLETCRHKQGHVMTTNAHNPAMLEAPATDGSQRRAASTHGSSDLLVLVFGPLAGLLLWLGYFPVNWGWLAWCALVPLLGLVRAKAPGWRIYLSAWLGGLLFFWPAIQWMRVA